METIAVTNDFKLDKRGSAVMTSTDSGKSFFEIVEIAARAFVDTASAASKLVIKSSQKWMLATVSLPDAYLRLGEHIHGPGKSPNQVRVAFPDRFTAIQYKLDDNLREIERLRPAPTAGAGTPVTSEDRKKQPEDAAKIRALKAENRNLFRQLGEMAFESHREKAGPSDLVGPLVECHARLEALGPEIQDLTTQHSHGFLTPMRLLVGTVGTFGVLAVVLFCLHLDSSRSPPKDHSRTVARGRPDSSVRKVSQPASRGKSPQVSPKPTVPPAPIEITPAHDVDERLFLTYVLHGIYEEWPVNVPDQQARQRSLDDLRHRANRFHEYVMDRNFDPKLTAMYADLLVAIDTFTAFLSDMGRVEREAMARVEREQAETTFTAGVTGGTVAAGASNNGASGGQAALAGLATGGFQWLMDNTSKEQARDEARRQAVEVALRRFEAKIYAINSRVENTELDLAARYGWRPEEMRSADPPAEAEQWKALQKANNIPGMVQLLDRKISRRPRDPMILAVRESVAASDSKATVSSMRASAERCLHSASRIPAGKIYDLHRAQTLYHAADIASNATTRELNGKAWGTARSQLAAWEVDIWDAVLRYYPGDDDGECRERRAWALMCSGRISEALAQARKVLELRRSTMRFAMNYARLENAAGDTKTAFSWFTHAVKTLGFNDVKHARTDPDLAAMRRVHAAAFEDLMKVKCTWDVQFGILNDDIVVTNTSAFAITNVEVDGKIESGGRSWTPVLKTPVIKSGETYKWVDVVSIPGGRIDRKNATVACDQNRD